MARHRSLFDRFWEKVDMRAPDDCWLWTGGRGDDGYGHFRINSHKQIQAHRMSWILANAREVPTGMIILHDCDNPPCVNPQHLIMGTQQQNMDMASARGHKVGTPKLQRDQVREIRERHARGEKQVALAHAFEISQSTISLIVLRKKWRQI